ncbi:MAG: flagellar basal body L-ring protein FlgH [Betaproteobacteria bacterium]|nr:flagellar basal body L-ring protein FlgH [Betaproteobacteria bacterium]
MPYALRRLSFVIATLVLAGCGTPPSTHITQPFTARPTDHLAAAAPANGAIFQTGGSLHPLFEDVRARNVGDTLTIMILENSAATEKNGNDANHASSITSNFPTVTVPATGKHILDGPSATATAANKLANTGDSSGSNFLTGSITATVIQVLPNGNLMVSGEKLVSINQVDEYIRISGVVNPANVQTGNTVLSTQVADARIEYKGGNANIDRAAVMSMLSRFFFSSMPF